MFDDGHCKGHGFKSQHGKLKATSSIDLYYELGVVDESKGYAPLHVPFIGDTQFGCGVAIIITDATTSHLGQHSL
jgi:hypothetical protein